MAGERKEIRKRVAAVLRDELSSDGWEVFAYNNVIGEGQKYLKVRTGRTTYQFLDANFTVEVLQVIITVITAYRTEGIDGEIEDIHDDMIDDVRVVLLSAFGGGVNSGQGLTSTDYASPPTYIDHRIGAALVSDEGAVVRQDSGVGQISLATAFVLEVPILTEVECSFP